MPNSARFGRLAATSGWSRTTDLPTNSAFSALFWLCRRGTGIGSAGADPAIFTYSNNGAGTTADWYALFMLGTGDGGTGDTPGLFNGVTSVASAAGIFTLDRWYHCAVTVSGTSGSNFLFYRDGVLDITHTAVAHVAGVQAIHLATDGLAQWADLNLAAVKLFNRALTVAEINAERGFALPVIRGGLNTACPLPNTWEALDASLAAPLHGPDRGTTLTRWQDWSGNGYEWTEIGTVDTEPGAPIRWAAPRHRLGTGKVAAAGTRTLFYRAGLDGHSTSGRTQYNPSLG